MKLQEIFESVLELIQEKGKNPNVLATLKFTGAKADSENLNKRTYPKLVLARAVEDFNDEIKKSNVTGIVSNLDHSKEIYPSLSSASHLITKLFMDGDLMKGEAAILNTTKGRDIMTVLKAGAKAGISIKGLGNIGAGGIIQPGLKLLSADIVNKPSFDKDVQISAQDLYESANPRLTEEQKDEVSIYDFNFLVEKLLDDTFGNKPREDFLDFCDENWQKYADQVEKSLEKVGKTVEESSVKVEVEIKDFPVSESHFAMAKLSGYRGTLNDFMELKKIQDDPLTSAFKEAELSGYEGTFADFKKRSAKK